MNRLLKAFVLCSSLLSLATLYEQIELFDEARSYYGEALREAEQGGSPPEIIDALIGYSGFLNDFGGDDSRQALPMAQRALQLLGKDGEQVRIGSALLQVGRASFGLQRYDEAEAAYRGAGEIADRTGTHALRAHVDFRWGELDFARHDLASALARIDASRVEYEREGNRHRLIKVHGVLDERQRRRHALDDLVHDLVRLADAQPADRVAVERERSDGLQRARLEACFLGLTLQAALLFARCGCELPPALPAGQHAKDVLGERDRLVAGGAPDREADDGGAGRRATGAGVLLGVGADVDHGLAAHAGDLGGEMAAPQHVPGQQLDALPGRPTRPVFGQDLL